MKLNPTWRIVCLCALAMSCKADPLEVDAGPADTNGGDGTAVSMRGVVLFGFELMAFQSCGDPEVMWLNQGSGDAGWATIADALVCTKPEAGYPICELVYAEVDGFLSPPGAYGHLSAFRHQLTLIRVNVASMTIPTTCDVVPPKW